ncbi:MAG TPA: MBL fold metallo-hydrolase [Caulobacterales bacterium]|nr:MBL fold metallo-hydrolase [Caulobacterales bacterium]
MSPDVHGFFHEATSTVTYLVIDPQTRCAALIDTVLDFEPANGRVSRASIRNVLAEARRLNADIKWILETHVHADHLSAAQFAKQETAAPIVIGAEVNTIQAIFAPRFRATDIRPDGGDFDRLVRDGDELPLGAATIRVMQTPGHTRACVSYLVGDAAFTGDTLFMPDYGTARTDFPGGDAATLYRSIQKIFSLPPSTRIFVGHDYKGAGRDAFAWETTVGAQRAGNVHIHDGIDEAAFVAARKQRDAGLAPPRLLLAALQVNIRGGRLPPADEDGVARLRIPVSIAD